MIRRHAGNDYLLITQNDHAILAGQLAAHFGNRRFAAPDPREQTLAGATFHDCGWPVHDDLPTLNPKGQPIDVFESTIALAVKVWSASASRAAAHGDYAGLLVSLHVLNLSGFAGARELTRREQFELNQFQQGEFERQENYRKRLGLRTDLPLRFGLADPGADPSEDQLAFNYRVIQATDQISLGLCCTEPPFKQIKNLHAATGSPPITLTLERSGPTTLEVDPWPFDVRELSFKIPYRRISAQTFATLADFQQAWDASATEQLALEVHGRQNQTMGAGGIEPPARQPAD